MRGRIRGEGIKIREEGGGRAGGVGGGGERGRKKTEATGREQAGQDGVAEWEDRKKEKRRLIPVHTSFVLVCEFRRKLSTFIVNCYKNILVITNMLVSE